MALKEAAAKLPLAVRRNVRDEWETKKPEAEKKLSTILGTPWTFDINPLALFPYADEGSYGYNYMGECIYDYVKGAILELQRYADSHGKTGIEELNSVCSNHAVTVLASTDFNYCGATISDGKLNIAFHPTCFGSNTSMALCEIADVVSAAPQPKDAPKLSFATRHSIAIEYEAVVPRLLERARKALQNPQLVFDPDFEGLAAVLKTSKGVRSDWEKYLGAFVLQYYEGFVDTLVKEKFEADDLLREGFEEGVPKAVVRLRLVEQMPGINEIVVEDGVCIMQTTPAYFGSNISQAAQSLVDIL